MKSISAEKTVLHKKVHMIPTHKRYRMTNAKQHQLPLEVYLLAFDIGWRRITLDIVV